MLAIKNLHLTRIAAVFFLFWVPDVLEGAGNLDELLVDQFMAGVRSKTVTDKILDSEKGLDMTFKEAMEIAITFEGNDQYSSMSSRNSVKNVSLSGGFRQNKNKKHFQNNQYRKNDTNNKQDIICLYSGLFAII